MLHLYSLHRNGFGQKMVKSTQTFIAVFYEFHNTRASLEFLMNKMLFFILSLAPLVSTANDLLSQDVIQIHISPHSIQGLRTYPSLQQAIDQADVLASSDASTIKFVIHTGTYSQQAAILRSKSGVNYEFTAASTNEKLPDFNGDFKQLTWLRVLSTNRNTSSVTINNLKIRNYVTAISIEGDREDPSSFNAGNKIYNMYFDSIGQMVPGSPPSTAVIRFVNSRDNEILDNDFINIKNVENCGLLHTIYLAHHSSNNLILRNKFTNLCGSPIRLRDDSNNNNAQQNIFSNIQRDQLMDQWFCDKTLRNDCTKSRPELRSHSNIMDMKKIAP
jgi:hypothetical protein